MDLKKGLVAFFPLTGKPKMVCTHICTPGTHIHTHSPVAIRWDEVQATVNAVILQGSTVHTGLIVQVLLKLGVDVIENWLPATRREDNKFT